MSIGTELPTSIGRLLLRSVITLVLTGAYMHYLMEINNTWLNVAWLTAMTIFAAVCTMSTANILKIKRLLLPIFAGMAAGLITAGGAFMLCAGMFDKIKDAHYLVPVAGLLLSTMMSTCAAGIRTYSHSLIDEEVKYNFLIGNGATHTEATAPFVRKALESCLSPMTEGITITQLVCMPAMLGMVFGGCPPVTAIKYQLLLLAASFVASVIALTATMYFADKTLFDNFGRIRHLRGMSSRQKNAVATLMLLAVITACTSSNGHRPLIGGDITERTHKAESTDGGSTVETQSPTITDLELPAIAPEDIILRRAGYTTCYDVKNKIPHWVAWHLTASHTTGTYNRKNQKFMEDTDVPEPRATYYDFIQSGYDRGHMCPSGDCKWSEAAQEQSFLLTNVCPQNPNLNRGDWNEMELLCRDWAQKYGDLYIVCGPVLLNTRHKRIGKNKVTVPEAFFKVVMRTSPDTCAIGFIYRNTDGNHPKDSYKNSVDEVERITGLDFFNKLPRETEERIEKTADLNQWQ